MYGMISYCTVALQYHTVALRYCNDTDIQISYCTDSISYFVFRISFPKNHILIPYFVFYVMMMYGTRVSITWYIAVAVPSAALLQAVFR